MTADAPLVGRDADLAWVRDALAGPSRVAAVVGAPGEGKTALLGAVAQRSADEGSDVVRLQGRRAETVLGSAVLLDLLDAAPHPANGSDSDPGGDALREDLLARLTTGEGPPEPLTLRRDLRRWLVEDRPRPLLLVVDDVPWVDRSSWQVLTFVLHRLGGTSVSALVAGRGSRPLEGLEGLPHRDLGPLSTRHAAALLSATAPGLSTAARAAALERAGGNPLALVELARVGDDRGEPTVLPDPVAAAFAADLHGLPHPTRSLLLEAAAGAEDLAVLDVLATPDDAAAVLAPAVSAGLLRLGTARVAFRHPLVAATVWGLASPEERRRAHLRLAAAIDDDDRSVWHLAAAAEAPDAATADALERVAERLARRGAQREAAAATYRAAELSSDEATRERRLLAALLLSTSIGDLAQATAASERLRRTATDPLVRARAAHAHAYALAQTTHQAAAQAELEAVVADLLVLDPSVGWAALTTLATLTYQTCEHSAVLEHWLRTYDSEQHAGAASPLDVAARAWVRTALDPLARPGSTRRAVRSAPVLTDVPRDLGVSHDVLVGATAWLLDEPRTALPRLTRAAETAEALGASQLLAQSLVVLVQVQFDTGLWDQAEQSAQLLVDLGEALDVGLHRSTGHELLARVAAVRGTPGAAARVEELLAATAPGQAAALEANLLVDRAMADFAAQDHEGCYLHLRRLYDAAGEPLHPHVSSRALGHLVSAAVRLGRAEEVAPLVDRAEHRLPDQPGQRLSRTLARAMALLAGPQAGPLFERALHEAGAEEWPFDHACAQLDHGLWLRRQQRPADARLALRSAHDTFRRLGAAPWQEMAATELRAAGVRLEEEAAPEVSGPVSLTAQEREVVELAARGHTNREIAQALFISPRTVGAHLYHAFPKLGVTSRTQLRDVLDP